VPNLTVFLKYPKMGIVESHVNANFIGLDLA